MNRINVFV